MATITGGIGYGLYVLLQVIAPRPRQVIVHTIFTYSNQRYVLPLIAPPTPPQLQQDKEAIDASFSKAFALLDQLGTDTQSLKATERARSERLDVALQEVETVLGELKQASARREEEVKRLHSDVRSMKDSLQRGLENQNEKADSRLKDLHTELKGLKTLVGNRLAAKSRSAARESPSATGGGKGGRTTEPVSNGAHPWSPSDSDGPDERASLVDKSNDDPTASIGAMDGENRPKRKPRAVIPAWQMAAADKVLSASLPPSSEDSIRE